MQDGQVFEQRERRATKRFHWIPVVAGVIRSHNKVLIGLRPENHSLAGQWEFPGGKIESGEGPEEALRREMREELGIEVDVGRLLLAVTHSYGEVNILILFYEILYWKGEPKPQHHQSIEWIEPKDFHTRPIPEANKKVLPRIFSAEELAWLKS